MKTDSLGAIEQIRKDFATKLELMRLKKRSLLDNFRIKLEEAKIEEIYKKLRDQ